MVSYRALRVAILVGFASCTVACGAMEVPMTMALEEGSSMDIWGGPDPATQVLLGTVDLEGGVETLMTTQIDLLDLLLQRPMFGVVEIDNLLFAGTPFKILGIDTGQVCAIPDPNVAAGGTVAIDLFDCPASIQFAIDMATVIKVANPVLSANIPDGFPITLAVESAVNINLIDMIRLFLGDADGVLSITQTLDEQFSANIGGILFPLGVTGELTLTTVSEFPSSAGLDNCIDLLGL